MKQHKNVENNSNKKHKIHQRRITKLKNKNSEKNDNTKQTTTDNIKTEEQKHGNKYKKYEE